MANAATRRWRFARSASCTTSTHRALADAAPRLPVVDADGRGHARRRPRPVDDPRIARDDAGCSSRGSAQRRRRRAALGVAHRPGRRGRRCVVAGFDAGVGHDGTWRLRTNDSGRPGAGGRGLSRRRRRSPPVRAASCTRFCARARAATRRRCWTRGRRRVGAQQRRARSGAVPSRLVLLVPLLPRRDRGPHPEQPGARRTNGRSTCSRSTTATSRPSVTGSRPTTSSRPSSRDARVDHRGRRPSAGYLVGAVHRRARLGGGHRAPRVAGARVPNGKPLWGMFNPTWGGGLDGVMYALDTTQPEVVAHLEHVARSLVGGRLHLPEARLHVRTELRRRVGRRRVHAGRAGARRVRRRSPRARATTRSCSVAARR